VTADNPAVAQYEPALHEEHAGNPIDAWKYPAPQLVHELAEEAEYIPIAQTPVTADRPVVAQ